jgi:hypothetical protein
MPFKEKTTRRCQFWTFEAIEAKRRRIDHKLEDAARDLLLIKREQEIAKLKVKNLQLKIQLNYWIQKAIPSLQTRNIQRQFSLWIHFISNTQESQRNKRCEQEVDRLLVSNKLESIYGSLGQSSEKF